MASFKNLISTTSAQIASGGTISGNLTIDGDLTVNGDGAGAYDEIISGALVIDETGGTSNSAIIQLKADRPSDGQDSSEIQFWNDGGTAIAEIIAKRGDSDTAGDILINTSNAERIRIDQAGDVGINMSVPEAKLNIMSGNVGLKIGGDVNAETLTNDTRKYARFTMHHYHTSEEGITLITGDSDGTDNIVAVGGMGSQNASTQVRIYTAANDATTTGTERIRVDSSGDVGIGRTPQVNHASYTSLEIGGDGTIMSHSTAGGGATYYGNGFYYDGSFRFISASAAVSGAANINMQDAEMVFQIASSASHSAGDALSFSTKFKLDANSRMSMSNNDSGDYNTLFGKDAGVNMDANSEGNTFIGHLVGDGSLSGADYNTGVGYAALSSLTTGDDNIAIGAIAANALSSGSRNTIIGSHAMKDGNTSQVTAVGHHALMSLTSGADNTALGESAGKYLSTGSKSVFVGVEAGLGVSGTPLTGEGNTIIGYRAGKLLRGAAAYNICIGDNAGDVITTGTQNISLGSGSDISSATGTNQIAIGYGTTGTGDNEIAFGNSSVSAIKAQVTSITAYSSDERTKKDIKDYNIKGLDLVNDLQLKTYVYLNPADYPKEIRDTKWDDTDEDGNLVNAKPSDPTDTQVGFIAQEVEAALKKHGVDHTETYAPIQKNGIKTLTYGNLIFPLIKAVQELSAKVDELEKQCKENK